MKRIRVDYHFERGPVPPPLEARHCRFLDWDDTAPVPEWYKNVTFIRPEATDRMWRESYLSYLLRRLLQLCHGQPLTGLGVTYLEEEGE